MIINFNFDTPYGRFSDALHFGEDLPSDAEIEAMKQVRLDNWIAAITAVSEEAPVEEALVEEVPVEEMLVEEMPVEEAPVEAQE